MCRYIFALMVLVCCGIACSDPPPLQLTKEETKWIDSVFFTQKDSLTSLYDSLCIVKKVEVYQEIKDSLISDRIREIEEILSQ